MLKLPVGNPDGTCSAQRVLEQAEIAQELISVGVATLSTLAGRDEALRGELQFVPVNLIRNPIGDAGRIGQEGRVSLDRGQELRGRQGRARGPAPDRARVPGRTGWSRKRRVCPGPHRVARGASAEAAGYAREW